MSEQKIFYVGARKMSGVSKNTGAEYDMCTLYYAVDAEARLGKLQREHEAIGKEIKEKGIVPALFEQLKKIEPMTWILVTVAPDPENIDRTIFSSVKPAQVSRAA